MTGIPSSTGAVWMVDPHLVVLGVLVAGWVLDEIFAALEWLRGSRPDGAPERRGAPVETGGPTDAQADGRAGGSRPSGAE